ncbi:aminotransferase class I/II-fold pyridoxal phosphate-dependent enzyme [Neolewinella sp.]|uniref:aminotransferase class I/II-fold pyridoxal phosphate-dependent enzyme n=1 Tax=Neolewinella sp. TaxID=2993543 RepID=UPI003B5267E4
MPFLTHRLEALRESGTYRTLPGQREGIDFWSNDYLGFAHTQQQQGVFPSTRVFASIAPGSRLISGDHGDITALEQHIADFHGHPAALLFGSGYTANLGVLSCLARRSDTIIYDALIHASIRDGIRLSGAAARRCQHNDVEDVRRLLATASAEGERFVVTESRFSMDGDLAPLPELAEVCAAHGAHLIVDEAHSIGIDGSQGAGLVAELGLQDQVLATITTYGKAPAASGAAVLGERALRDYLINFSRPFIFTTGPRPEQLTAIARGYDLLNGEQTTARAKLAVVIERFCTNTFYQRVQGPTQQTRGPIQLVYPRSKGEVMDLEADLLADGYLVKGIRYPSVARGEERLRICLHAFNTLKEVDGLCSSLRRHLERRM